MAVVGFDIKCRRFTHSYLVQPFCDLFKVLGADIPAVYDYDVFAPPGQVEVLLEQVSQVTGVQPTVFKHHPVGRLLIVQVAVHQAGAFYQYPADAQVG